MGDVVHLARLRDSERAELDEVERLVVKLLRTVDPDRIPVVLAAAGHQVGPVAGARALRP